MCLPIAPYIGLKSSYLTDDQHSYTERTLMFFKNCPFESLSLCLSKPKIIISLGEAKISRAAMVYFQSANPLSKGERDMELVLSPLHLLADTASMVSEGKLSLGPSTFDLDVEKKATTVTTTTFGPIHVGWIVRKKRTRRPRRPTSHARNLNFDPAVIVQCNRQETSRGVAENCKKRSRVRDFTGIQELNGVPKKTKKTGMAAPVRPSELAMKYMDKIREMHGRDVMLVVEKRLTATDMSRDHSRLSIPNMQIREDFLSKEENQILDRKEGVRISLIEPCLEVSHGLNLKKWSYRSKSFSYMLTERWNVVAHPYERNELIKDAIIQLWSFRVDGNLCFCLVKVEAQLEAMENMVLDE